MVLGEEIDEDEGMVLDRVTVNAVELQEDSEESQKENFWPAVEVHNSDLKQPDRLFIVEAVIDKKVVKILLDTGATSNLIKPGIASKVLCSRRIQAQRFDGTVTPFKTVKEVEATVKLRETTFPAMKFVEWNLPDGHDVIFGKPWFSRYNPRIDWRSHTLAFPDQTCLDYIDGSTFSRRMNSGAFAEIYRMKMSSVNVDKSTIPDILKPVLLEEFADIFPDKLPDGLPPSRSVNFELQMKPNAVPSARAPFRLSRVEQEALQQFVEENLRKGWIEVSNSPWVSNIFGILKKDPVTGSFPRRAEWLRSGNSKIPIRWVIDYRYVNSSTVVAKIPLPLIEELFDQMVGCKVYTLLDLAQGYHQTVVESKSRPYTAFRTQKETYQWCVAPMGLAGMPGVWSRLMRTLFDKFDFVVVYLDDICIFSKTMEDHVLHVRAVCEVLRKEKLFAQISKCSFGQPSVAFLGHTVCYQGLSVDTRKTEAISKYPTPNSRKTLLSFLGLAGYYRRFICDFAKIASPLRELTKQDVMWKWGNNEEQAFRALKLALQQAPTLKLPDFSQKFIVTTDASGYCMGGVLSQKFQDGEHPIAFYSKKFGPYEAKWPAHEKELLAIKTALEKWRPYLHGRPFDVYTDNSACSWMLHHPKVSPKMARFLTFFSQFEFVLHHVRGTSNVVADGLSRPPQESGNECANEEIDIPDVKYKVHNCDDECITHALATNQHRVGSAAARHMPVDVSSLLLDDVHLLGECRLIGVQQEQVHSVDIHSVRVHLSPEVKKKFQSGYAKDPAFEKVWKSLTPDSTFVKFNGLLFLKTSNSVFRLCVPSDKKLITQVIMEFHDAPTSAHPGIRRTQLKAAQWYYWPTLDKDIKEYVNSCETCARWKSSNRMKNGLLMPIPVPQECWEVVSMDFIVKLPVSNGYDAIFVAVDKLSKRAKYAPTHTTANAEDTARVFFDAVVRHHGVPKIIISDRDPKFISDFWKSLMKIMGIKLSMTTSHRPQADGQTERQNLVLEDALRCVVSYHGDDWNRHLGTIEYAHATLVNVSTKMSPFELDTGRKVSNLIAEEINGIASSDFTVSIAEYAKRFATERQKIVNQARRNLLQAQERQKKYYDRKRRDVKFKSGDLVMLDTKNLPLKTVNVNTDLKKAKLAAKKIGPFEIEHMVNDNVARLKLPRSMQRLNPTFNIDLLSPYSVNISKFPGRPLPKATPIILDTETGEELHIVEQLLKFRHFNRQREWFVKWHGLPSHESTWERERTIKHVSHWHQLTQDFHNRQREVKAGGMS
ncbi:Retroelement pol polyprotein, partial [Globisporangium splendens]